MQYIKTLVIITLALFTFSTVLADHHGHSDDANHHASSDNHDHHKAEESAHDDSHDMSDGHHDTSEEHATDKESHEHHDSSASHDDSKHDDEHHEHHETAKHSGESANVVMLGEKTLMLYPLLSPDENFQILIDADKAGYTTSVSYEDTPLEVSFDDSGRTQIDLANAQQGTYHLTFRDQSNTVTVPVSVYKAETNSGKSFTAIFAPSPSLSTSGKSEVFIYNIAQGENLHELINVNYKMDGMQHSMDNVMTPLVHEHFDALKGEASEDNPALTTAMSNRSSLSFAMAGQWKFNIMVDGELLSFYIEMFNN